MFSLQKGRTSGIKTTKKFSCGIDFVKNNYYYKSKCSKELLSKLGQGGNGAL